MNGLYITIMGLYQKFMVISRFADVFCRVIVADI